ncbi:hypothetical protein LTR99_011129 [Exophiala xenobiotica]|nr:hypothetical protein LTR41_009955 [Exophiala xenobiotica]KAK5290185.1 hypothetical protein LTR99_011129 [Exophiala xenobiotica]KAK5362954.1 hypothetical protein LTS13_009280 [Exophiala xenobiotica]KAK5392023.1 hypothetical protein LTR79_010431 [Exophiala xenobiotica]KAK5407573.1 hypothetical protein LTR90_009747 [Exophiala xenobiotica]
MARLKMHRQSPLHRCLWQLMKVRAKERAQHGEAEGFMTEILEFFTSVPPAQFQRAVMHIYNVIKERQHQFHGHFKRALLEISEVASHLAEGKDPQVAQIRGVMALWQYEFRDQPVSIPNWEGFCQPRRIPISPKRVPRTSEDASGLYVIGSFRDLLNNRISRNNEPDIVRTIAEEIYALAKQSTGRDYAIDMYNR